MMRSSLVFYLFVSMLLSTASARGEQPASEAQVASGISPVGRWKTVDDATGTLKSLVVIWEENGKLFGRVEKVLDPAQKDPDPKCVHCEGELKNKPIIGMRILWDLKKNGDQWSGGKILDPDNGKTYKCYVTVEDGGDKLKVRGFIGFSLLGRTQYWLREK